MKYGELNLGQIEAVVNKLGGMDGVQRFLAGETVVKIAEPPIFPIWKTIKLGTGPKTADDFRRALKSGDCHISNWGNDILGQSAFTASETETEVDLVVVSVAELVFKDGATREDIYKRAIELGLQLAPAEVGPQLRLQYPDQPRGEWLLIGMKPITGSGGDLDVFVVGRDGGERWLSGYFGGPDSVWPGDDRWVFVSSK